MTATVPSPLTFPPLLGDHVLALRVEDVEVVGHHALLALLGYLAVRVGMQELAATQILVIQPTDHLKSTHRGRD
jgi:hypothetical protein